MRDDGWLEVIRISHPSSELARKAAFGAEAASRGQVWYWHAPGSGIFYDGGAVCSAPGKIHMLLRLVQRWNTAPNRLRALSPAVGAQLARLQNRMHETALEGVERRLNQTAHGVRGCASVRLESWCERADTPRPSAI